jgi:hypothetical protein
MIGARAYQIRDFQINAFFRAVHANDGMDCSIFSRWVSGSAFNMKCPNMNSTTTDIDLVKLMGLKIMHSFWGAALAIIPFWGDVAYRDVMPCFLMLECLN